MEKYFLLILLLLPIFIFADNIYLKNGSVIVNVKIIKTENGWISYQKSDGKILKIKETVVSKIDNVPFDPKKETQFLKKDFLALQTENYVERLKNFKLFPISILAFALSYDYFNSVDDYNYYYHETEKRLNSFLELYRQNIPIELKYEIDRLYTLKDRYKKIRNRKKIMAFLFLGVGIINTYVSLKPVKLEATNNKIGLTVYF